MDVDYSAKGDSPERFAGQSLQLRDLPQCPANSLVLLAPCRFDLVRWTTRFNNGRPGADKSLGLIMSSLDMTFLFSGHAPGADMSAEAQTAMAQNVRLFALFLFSLSILVLATTRQGWLAIQNKEQRIVLRAPLHTALNCRGRWWSGYHLAFAAL